MRERWVKRPFHIRSQLWPSGTWSSAMARRGLAVLLAVVVLLAGCSGAGGGDGGDAGGGDGADAGNDLTAAGDGGSGGGGGGDGDGDGDAAMALSAGTAQERSAVALQRQLILTGEIRLRVEEFEGAQSNVTRLARSYGGFVSDSNREVEERGNETWTRGTVVVRVPRENFTALFGDVQGVGEVERATRSSEDVTDRVVDLEARLENLRAERDRLRSLYRRANDTEDVLRVQERLSEVQGEIERTEAKLRSLRNRVGFSTVTVHLQEPRPRTPLEQRLPWWETPVLRAFLQSVDGVATTLRALGVGVAYALPYVLVFGTPLAGAILLYRRRAG